MAIIFDPVLGKLRSETPIEKTAYSIDFETNDTEVQVFNISGNIEILKVGGENIANLWISFGDVVDRRIELGDQAILIPDNTTVTWKIGRAIEGRSAVLGVKYIIRR